jgi:hypothetical protein
VVGALAGPVAAHKDPQLGVFAQAAGSLQGRNTPPAKVRQCGRHRSRLLKQTEPFGTGLAAQ